MFTVLSALLRAGMLCGAACKHRTCKHRPCNGTADRRRLAVRTIGLLRHVGSQVPRTSPWHSERLNEYGLNEAEVAVTGKLARVAFSAAFVLACLTVLV